MALRIYLAGPDVFAPDPRRRGAELKALCTNVGAIGVFPLDNDVSDASDLPTAIRQCCLDLIRGCDVMVANMTPFRGPSLDPGTAYEMGFAEAIGKPVVGYTLDARSYLERVTSMLTVRRDASGVLRDADGSSVEDFGCSLVDNLMLARGVGALFDNPTAAIAYAAQTLRQGKT